MVKKNLIKKKRKRLPSYTYPPKPKVVIKDEKPIIEPADESLFIRFSPVLFLNQLQAKLRTDEPPKYHCKFDKEKKTWQCKLSYVGGEWSSENETRKWAKGEAAARAVLAIYKKIPGDCEEVKKALIRLTENDQTLLPPLPQTSPSSIKAFSHADFFRSNEKDYNLIVPTYAKSPIYVRPDKIHVSKDELQQNLLNIQ